MKKLRNLIAVMAMMSMAAMLTGCGDDDDDDDDDGPGGTNPPVVLAPLTIEELTAQNRTYNVSVAGQDPIALTFPASGQYQMVQGQSTETGTIANANRVENTWTMDVTPAAGQDGAQEGVLNLTWTGENAGTWTFTPTGGQAETGTFTVQIGGGGDTGDTGDTGGGGWPTNNDLTGRILQFNYTGGGGDKFTFTGPETHQWEDNTATGGYQFDNTTGNINLTIPSRGETFTATLTPGSLSGNTTVNLTSGSGTQSLPASYTLSNP